MKIAIDTFGCDHAESGLGSYIFYFVSNLPAVSDLQFELFGAEIDRYVYSGGKEIPFTSVNIPDDNRFIRRWHYWNCAAFTRKQNYDLVIYPAAEKFLPQKYKVPGIVVVNSILSVAKRGYKSRYLERKLHKGLVKATHIVAATNYIKQDLINCGIDSKKITVIHNGIDHKLFYPSLNLEDYVDVKPFSIKRPYFIYGSRLSGEDKRHEKLIQGFELFKKQTGCPHRLVISGGDGEYSDIVHQTAFDSQAASDIFLTGYFPQSSFSKLISGASACIFPAVNEGVGLPILEAMACGIPVLCSDKGALPEVGGTVPLYFDSDNPEDIASKMKLLVEDEALYKEKSAAGLEWSKQYNWEETVLKTVELGKSLIK